MIERFEHPWFLLLLLLVLLLIIFRKPKYFIRHSYLPAIMGAKKIALVSFLMWTGWLLIILATVDYAIGYKDSYQKLITHNYVLINDGSGSMVANGELNGVGKNLTTLLNANDNFLKTLESIERSDGNRDSVGMLVFSSDPFILSYFVEDYDFIRQKMFQLDWRIPPLNQGTEVNKAIWAGINLILKKNMDLGGSSFSDEELINLELGFRGESRIFSIQKFKFLVERFSLIRQQIKGSSMIIFTDGSFSIDGGEASMSVIKLLLFCKEMDIRVYFISVEPIDSVLINYVKLTGGEVTIVESFNRERISNAYKKIANQQAGEREIVDPHQKKSYSDLFAGMGLALLTIYVVLKNTVSR